MIWLRVTLTQSPAVARMPAEVKAALFFMLSMAPWAWASIFVCTPSSAVFASSTKAVVYRGEGKNERA